MQRIAKTVSSAADRQSSSMQAMRMEAIEASQRACRILSEIRDVKVGSSTTDGAARKVLDAAGTMRRQADAMSAELCTYLSESQAA